MRRRARATARWQRRIGALCAGLLTLLPPCALAAATAMTDMDDASLLGHVLVDQLEWRDAGGASAADWQAEAWYGGDYNKLWARSEGDWPDRDGARGRAELLWDRIATRWWSVQGGAR
jgi:copper resistance protein B